MPWHVPMWSTCPLHHLHNEALNKMTLLTAGFDCFDHFSYGTCCDAAVLFLFLEFL
jgi:hypothetical protein